MQAGCRRLIPPLAVLLIVGCAQGPISAPPSHAPPYRAPAEPADWRDRLPNEIDVVRASIVRYQDFEVAREEGWKAFGGDAAEEPLMGAHYYLPDGVDYVAGDPLDFSRPNNLMYAEIGGEMVLTGVAFVVRIGPEDDVPNGFSGPEDVWHVHDALAVVNASVEDRALLRGLAAWWLKDTYFREGDNRHRLAMVHVWVTLPNPDGLFADHNRELPYLKLGLPTDWAKEVSVEAARGLHLATRTGCADTLDGRLWIANASGRQKKTLKSRCAELAEAVRLALTSDPRHLARVSESAWSALNDAQAEVLTADQQRRIATLTEHGPHHGEQDSAHDYHNHP